MPRKKRIRQDSDEESVEQRDNRPPSSTSDAQAISEDDLEPDEFVVKSIVGHKITNKRLYGSNGDKEEPTHFEEPVLQFKIKWADTPHDRWSLDKWDTWEPHENLGLNLDPMLEYLWKNPAIMHREEVARWRDRVEDFVKAQAAKPQKKRKAVKLASKVDPSKAKAKEIKSKEKSQPKAKKLKTKKASTSSDEGEVPLSATKSPVQSFKSPMKQDIRPEVQEDSGLDSDAPLVQHKNSISDKSTGPSTSKRADSEEVDDEPAPARQGMSLADRIGKLTSLTINGPTESHSATSPITKSTAKADRGGPMEEHEEEEEDEDENALVAMHLSQGQSRSVPLSSASAFVANNPNEQDGLDSLFDAADDDEVADQGGSESPESEDLQQGKAKSHREKRLEAVRAKHGPRQKKNKKTPNDAAYCSKCKRASCRGRTDATQCDEGMSQPNLKPPSQSKNRAAVQEDEEPFDSLFDDVVAKKAKDKFGPLHVTRPKAMHGLDFHATDIETQLMNRLRGTRFQPKSHMSNKIKGENVTEPIFEFWQIRKYFSEADFTAIVKQKSVKIHAPYHRIVHHNATDDFALDVAALQLLCLKKGATECDFDAEDATVIFIHHSMLLVHKDLHTLVTNSRFNQLRVDRSDSAFFIFGTLYDRKTPLPLFKPIWTTGCVMTFTPLAILENPALFKQTLDQIAKNEDMIPMVKLWLHAGLLVDGGKLSQGSLFTTQPDLGIMLHLHSSTGKFGKFHIIRSSSIPATRVVSPVSLNKPINPFPSQVDVVPTRDLETMSSAAEEFAGDASDASLYVKPLEKCIENLRTKYLEFRKWVIVGTKAERQDFEARHLEGTESLPMEMLDLDDLTLELANVA